jgi:hypothetical protein
MKGLAMKLIRTATLGLLAALAVFAGSAQAQSTSTQSFKVNLTLTSKCYLNMAAGPVNGTVSDVNLTYIAFQTTAAQDSTGFTVTCTNDVPYSLAVASDAGTVAGIDYFLKLVAGTTASYATAAGGGTLASQTGSASGVAYTVGVQAAANQPGTCSDPTGVCTGFNTHIVTVSY